MMLPMFAAAEMKVVASTNDLAYFASEIGGELVEVKSIASPKADVHFVEVRPSFMMKVAKADVVLKVGLELDEWMDRIIDGSRNNDLVIVDCSRYIEPLEVPTFTADASHGDLHQNGNPHYWMYPRNVKPITDAIVEGLTQADPENAAVYSANQETYLARLESALETVYSSAAQLKGNQIVFYHNSWPYFNKFAGLESAGFIEPYPGVPPSPSHVKKMIELIRARGIKTIAVEPYFDRRVPNKIADETGATVVTLYPSVGGRQADESYVDWLSGNVRTLVEVLR
jgi:ABC-type Zn uptake system ZnuABC Zn-binding protein ZnuA